MPPDTPPSRPSPLKNPFLYSSLFLLVVAVTVAYILLSRYESNRQIDKRIRGQESQIRLQDDRRAIEQLGGSEFAIRGFYISPPVIRHGESADLCYDVDNAKTVTLDPPVAEVWPSHTRCLQLTPKKTTTYTLTISDASGKSISQSVELQVR